jgi:hypothetical protein
MSPNFLSQTPLPLGDETGRRPNRSRAFTLGLVVASVFALGLAGCDDVAQEGADDVTGTVPPAEQVEPVTPAPVQ